MMYGRQCGCCSCDSCKYMEFTVKGKQGEFLNYFAKEHNGYCNEVCTMADRYNFEMPSNNDDENAIFLATMQFIDMLYFEFNYGGAGRACCPNA